METFQRNVLTSSDTPLSSILETYHETTDFFDKSVIICVQLVLPSWSGCGLNRRTIPNGVSFTDNSRVHQQTQHFIRFNKALPISCILKYLSFLDTR
jgi:hypothetical protein